MQAKRNAHNDTNTHLHNAWMSIRRKCKDVNYKSFMSYGGVGVAVCEEWQEYVVFKKWALENGYRQGLFLNRRDIDGDFTPNNCFWDNKRERPRRSSNEHLITYNGETHNIKEWSKMLGVKPTTICGRISRGLPVDKVLSEKKTNKELYIKDLDGEEWRSVDGYDGRYEVSNYGRVKSLPKYNYKKSYILATRPHKVSGRVSVMLSDEHGKTKRVSVHRLVAMAFVENPCPERYTEINHKDENPTNNSADNLEWCDRWYNMHYKELHKRIKYFKRPVSAVNDNGDFMYFTAITNAKALGFDSYGIYESINKPMRDGSKRKYKGFYWRKGYGDQQ